MDGFFSWLLSKCSGLITVSTYVERVEFAAHVGWSIAVPALGHAIGGLVGLQIGFILIFVNSVVSEFYADGHLARVFRGQEPAKEFRDFLTDLLTKTAPGAIYALLEVRHL